MVKKELNGWSRSEVIASLALIVAFVSLLIGGFAVYRGEEQRISAREDSQVLKQQLQEQGNAVDTLEDAVDIQKDAVDILKKQLSELKKIRIDASMSYSKVLGMLQQIRDTQLEAGGPPETVNNMSEIVVSVEKGDLPAAKTKAKEMLRQYPENPNVVQMAEVLGVAGLNSVKTLTLNGGKLTCIISTPKGDVTLGAKDVVTSSEHVFNIRMLPNTTIKVPANVSKIVTDIGNLKDYQTPNYGTDERSFSTGETLNFTGNAGDDATITVFFKTN
jgi:Tfp pilus assembly protein PilO